MQTKPKVVVVDGNIAVGKTTWIDIIQKDLEQQGLRVCVVKEPVDEWIDIGILQKFYKNKKRYAYSFQTYVVISRVRSALEAYKTHGDNVDVYILERSCYTDALFAKINHINADINELEYSLYKEWNTFHSQFMPFTIDFHVYLRCSAEESYERCLQRSRDGECSISPEYLRSLLQLHDAEFLTKQKLFNYNTTKDYLHDLSLQQTMCSEFRNFLLA